MILRQPRFSLLNFLKYGIFHHKIFKCLLSVKNMEDTNLRVEHEKKSFLNKMKENPWMISTFALALIVAVFLGFMIADYQSKSAIGNVVKDFAEAQGISLEVNNVEDEDSFYKVDINLNGKDSAVFVTKDGKYMIQPLAELDSIDNPQTTSSTGPEQEIEEDWTVFETELSEELKTKILGFGEEELVETDNQRVKEFKGYDECDNNLIVFYSPGCGWCTKYYPVLIQVKQDYPDITIYGLNLRENRDIAAKFGASGTPANVINCKYFASGYMDQETLYGVLDEFE